MAIGCRIVGWHECSECGFDRVRDFGTTFEHVDANYKHLPSEVQHGVHAYYRSDSAIWLYGAEFRLKGIETKDVRDEKS